MNKGTWITDAKGNRRPAQRIYDERGRYVKTIYTDKKGGEFKGFTEAEKAAARGKPIPEPAPPPVTETSPPKDK